MSIAVKANSQYQLKMRSDNSRTTHQMFFSVKESLNNQYHAVIVSQRIDTIDPYAHIIKTFPSPP